MLRTEWLAIINTLESNIEKIKEAELYIEDNVNDLDEMVDKLHNAEGEEDWIDELECSVYEIKIGIRDSERLIEKSDSLVSMEAELAKLRKEYEDLFYGNPKQCKLF